MATSEDERAGAEIVFGKEACDRFSLELIKEFGFPSGCVPGGDLIECGRVKATDFVWWKCKATYEYFSAGTNSKATYAAETTAYMEKGRMKKMTGVKTKSLMLWLTIVEMYIDGDKLAFKSTLGVGKSFPITNFMNEEEKKIYLEQKKIVQQIN